MDVDQIADRKLFWKGFDTYYGQNIKLKSPKLQWTTQLITLLIIRIIQLVLKFVLIKHYDESLMDLHSLIAKQIDASYDMQT